MRERLIWWRFGAKLACLALAGWLVLSVVPETCRSFTAYEAAELELERASEPLSSDFCKAGGAISWEQTERFRRAQDEYVRASSDLRDRIRWLL